MVLKARKGAWWDANKVGLSPSDVWHVGDSLRLDIGGAKATGLTAVWLNRTRAECHEDDPLPDLEITSLAGLIESLTLG